MATKKILITEDEEFLSEALELTLKDAGFHVVCAYNGEEALDYLSKGKFDLILLDLIMPKMDGFTVLKTLQEKNNKIPIIVLSNLSHKEGRARSLGLGAMDYYVKSDTELKTILERILEIL